MNIPPDPLDANNLSRTLVRVLRQGHIDAGLAVEPGGWFLLDEVVRVISLTLKVELVVADLESTRLMGGVRWEIESGRIRIIQEIPREEVRPYQDGPDILYHVVSRERLMDIRRAGTLAAPQGRPLPLTRQEEQAWRIGHRRWEDPVVLFVDAARARRDGLRFTRTRAGQFQAPLIPVRHVLNLREHFAEQASAGGFLVDWSRGQPRIALVRVVRRSGVTWEVAKGKIEAGEVPTGAAVREVQEEMGIRVALKVTGNIGTIRYGFSTPDGQPRLKTIYLYLLESHEPVLSFSPARREGIDAVRWFPIEEAIRLMTHPSLRASVGRLIAVLGERAAELGITLEVPALPGIFLAD